MITTKKPILCIAGASLLMVTACTDPGQVQGPNNNQNTQSGALLGGIIGAGLGVIVSDDNAKGAVIGGLVGATAGGVIGYNLDKQAEELRQSLDDDVKIVNTGDRLIVSLPQDILFQTDSSQLTGGLRSDLVKVADSLQKYPSSKVQVVGHADNTGSFSYNQDLSERRAEAVADVLLDNDVRFDRIQAFGRGEDQPIASNLTPEGRAQNRRVEIVILPTET